MRVWFDFGHQGGKNPVLVRASTTLKELFEPPNSGEIMPALVHVLGSSTITHVTDATYRFDCPFSAPCRNVVARVPSQASGRCAPSLSFTMVWYAVVDLVEGDVARQAQEKLR